VFLGGRGFSGAPLALGSLVVGESSGREVRVLGERQSLITSINRVFPMGA